MKTLAELYSHPNFHPFPQSSDEWINDPERMQRCHEAAGDGCEGSTHAEIIQDWREFLNSLTVMDEYRDGDLTQDEFDAIDAEIDACEAWHEKNGSLNEQVG